MIDYNDDNYIDEQEWNDYTTIWYEPYDNVSYNNTYDFNYYDTDNDGYIEVSEYEAAYDNSLYEAWDTDNDGYIDYFDYDTTANMYVDYDNDGLYEW